MRRARISSLFSSIKSLKVEITRSAFSSRFAEYPANRTLSRLTLSMIWSWLRRTFSIKSRTSGFWNGSTACLISSFCALVLCSGVGETVPFSVQALAWIISSSKAFNKPSATCSADFPTVSRNCLCSLRSILQLRRITRFASEVSVSSSRAPRAMFIISSFMETVGFRSSVRVSVFLDSVTPTASTITKWSLFSVAEGVTFCRSSLLRTRVPRPFICSK